MNFKMDNFRIEHSLKNMTYISPTFLNLIKSFIHCLVLIFFFLWLLWEINVFDTFFNLICIVLYVLFIYV